MPNLRSDLIGSENSGDSTESLIDEAEEYLRRSIDSMLTISSADYWNRQSARRRRARRHSEPDLFREWNPPRDARPYLPKVMHILLIKQFKHFRINKLLLLTVTAALTRPLCLRTFD